MPRVRTFTIYNKGAKGKAERGVSKTTRAIRQLKKGTE